MIEIPGGVNVTGGLIPASQANIGVDRTGLQALYLGSGYDTTGNGNTGTASGAVTYSADTYGKYVDINGDRDFTAGTGTVAILNIGNKLNFTEATNFSYICTFSAISLPPNNYTGVFGSGIDSCIYYSNTGALIIGIRGATTVSTIIGTNYLASRLGETHTVGLSYDSATAKYYVYLDGILQNTGGTAGPTSVLTNSWGLGDNYILSGNSSSGRKKIYRAGVWNRVLSQAEQLAFHQAATQYMPNPIARYDFDGNANDTSGNAYNGTVTGATLTTGARGVANTAYAFNGTNQYITLPTAAVPTSTLPVTIEAIANRASVDAGFEWVFFAGARTNNNSISIDFLGSGNQKIRAVTWGGTGVESNSNYVAGTWYHIVARFDVGGICHLFVNGVKQTATQTYSSLNVSSTFREIGRGGVNNTEALTGNVDCVRIYDKALSDEQIMRLYQQSGI